MLNGLRMRLQSIKATKDQHIGTLNAIIGREQELSELIEKLEALEKAGKIPEIIIADETPQEPVDPAALEAEPVDPEAVDAEAVE